MMVMTYYPKFQSKISYTHISVFKDGENVKYFLFTATFHCKIARNGK